MTDTPLPARLDADLVIGDHVNFVADVCITEDRCRFTFEDFTAYGIVVAVEPGSMTVRIVNPIRRRDYLLEVLYPAIKNIRVTR